ncbi:hypothetical protein GJ496_004450 [Pomphorhynchus laevis]|nr:hypothetical protein GJ496_004450 [Pomphorhynchus laevis]
MDHLVACSAGACLAFVKVWLQRVLPTVKIDNQTTNITTLKSQISVLQQSLYNNSWEEYRLHCPQIGKSLVATINPGKVGLSPYNIVKAIDEAGVRVRNIIMINGHVGHSDNDFVVNIQTDMGVHVKRDQIKRFVCLPAKRTNHPAWLKVSLNEGIVHQILRVKFNLLVWLETFVTSPVAVFNFHITRSKVIMQQRGRPIGGLLIGINAQTLSTAYYIKFSTTPIGDLDLVNAPFLISEISGLLGRLLANKATGLDGLLLRERAIIYTDKSIATLSSGDK